MAGAIWEKIIENQGVKPLKDEEDNLGLCQKMFLKMWCTIFVTHPQWGSWNLKMILKWAYKKKK